MVEKLARLALLGGVVASVGLATPAHAATCVGTQQTAGICVWLEKTTVYEDCVYVGQPPCIPVTVPGYDLECGGWIGDNTWFQCA
jgi:nitrate reductase cytochrome c-type subunit